MNIIMSILDNVETFRVGDILTNDFELLGSPKLYLFD